VPAIEVRSLSKSFGATRAVDDLSFAVPEGRVTGFLGPNGAGKSTTLRAILGLIRVDAGDALVDGKPFRELDDPLHRVGGALEVASFHPGRTGRAHLRSIAAVAGIPDSRVLELLALVELTDAADRRAGGYSLGMRQRLALASALIGDPGVLVLDEPANGLDPQGIRWLRDLLRTLAAEGRAILVSSHLLAEISQTADALVVIRRGRLVAEGSIAELTAGDGAVRVRSPRLAELVTLIAGAGGTTEALDGERVLVRGVTAEQVGTIAAEQGIPLFELSPQEASLEEAFLELTGGEEV
jgi:ABC-2 type transport system ATP-binding protein